MDAGIIHERGQTTERRFSQSDGVLPICHSCRVEVEVLSARVGSPGVEFAGECAAEVIQQVADDHTGAVLHESPRLGSPDPTGSAGYNDHVLLKSHPGMAPWI